MIKSSKNEDYEEDLIQVVLFCLSIFRIHYFLVSWKLIIYFNREGDKRRR